MSNKLSLELLTDYAHELNLFMCKFLGNPCSVVVTKSAELVEVVIALNAGTAATALDGQMELSELLSEPCVGEEEVRWLMTRHGMMLFDSDSPTIYLYKLPLEKNFTQVRAGKDGADVVGAALSRTFLTVREAFSLGRAGEVKR